MKSLISILSLLPVLAFAAPDLPHVPASRLDNETYQQALKRIEKKNPQLRSMHRFGVEAVNQQVPYKDIDYSLVPVVLTKDELTTMFKVMRDSRFLKTKDNKDFLRRISWLFPDDGCFARAAVGGKKLADDYLTRPAKVFAFGSLMVTTPYSPRGFVRWWYHVAPIVGYHGDYYVLDPAIEPKEPLKVADWFRLMTNNMEEVNGVVCSSYTYNPYDECLDASDRSEKRGMSDEGYYLGREWDRLDTLGFNPELLLGEAPPWL